MSEERFDWNEGAMRLVPFFGKNYGHSDAGANAYNILSLALRITASMTVNFSEGLSMFAIGLLLQEIPKLKTYLTDAEHDGLFFSRNFQLGYIYYQYFIKGKSGVIITTASWLSILEEGIASVMSEPPQTQWKGIAEGMATAFLVDRYIASRKGSARKTWFVPFAMLTLQAGVHLLKKNKD
jgi:hypothetical protein